MTRTRICAVAAMLVGLLLSGCEGGRLPSVDTRAADAGAAAIKVLSNRADIISGGNALVEIVMPPGVTVEALEVRVDGRDVSDVFARRANGRVVGLVDNLAEGKNELTVRFGGGRGQGLTITNHPIGGPVFSGPQIQPWPCEEGALDEQCNRETRYEYYYKPQGAAEGTSVLGQNVGGGFQSYDPDNPPDDVAQTTTDEGETVPYIVRQEIGNLNRSEYRIAVLYMPDQTWEPWAPQSQFNQKLVITHGSGCDTTYGENSAPDVLLDVALSRGFAVMSHALDHNTLNCNVVTQGESLIMTKEHLVETYGELRYTIGTGCSGGAVAQQQMANAYPGLYQGITPACSFPDSWSSRMLYEDYSLLRNYFENPDGWAPGVAWTTREIEAVWGHPNPVNAAVYNTAIAPVIDPSRSCPGVPAEDVYDPDTNPEGVRCSLQDYMVSVLGRRPKDGFAGKPWDNEGVLYGLNGLLDGTLTPAQFVDVNAKVGGRDIDYEWQPERFAGDVFAIAAVYRSGAFNTASNLDQTAIIDLRGPDPGAFHDVYRTYAMRARLEREHGHAGNQILWRGMVALFGDVTFADDAILAMDEWLAAVEADPRDIPYAQKIVEDRPDTVTDRCTNGAGTDIDTAVCDAVVQIYSTARIEAGMPFTDDVAKCRLKPLIASDYYPATFTGEQWAQLQQTFPTGVCDFSVPGVGQQNTIPWATFKDGPGGKPLGPAPRSQPL